MPCLPASHATPVPCRPPLTRPPAPWFASQGEDSITNMHFLRIDCAPLKQTLLGHCEQWVAKFTGLLNTLAATELNAILSHFKTRWVFAEWSGGCMQPAHGSNSTAGMWQSSATSRPGWCLLNGPEGACNLLMAATELQACGRCVTMLRFRERSYWGALPARPGAQTACACAFLWFSPCAC